MSSDWVRLLVDVGRLAGVSRRRGYFKRGKRCKGGLIGVEEWRGAGGFGEVGPLTFLRRLKVAHLPRWQLDIVDGGSLRASFSVALIGSARCGVVPCDGHPNLVGSHIVQSTQLMIHLRKRTFLHTLDDGDSRS